MGSSRSVSCVVALTAALLVLPATAFGGGPTARIVAPSASVKWTAGGAIAVSGSGTGAGGRELPDRSLHWTLGLQPCAGCSVTEVADLYGRTGTFTAPDRATPAQLVVSLTATDGRGSSSTRTVLLDASDPVVALRSEPPGLALRLDGETLRTPAERSFVAGASVALAAPASQLALGYDYTFAGWRGRDAGRETTITVSDADTTYDAVYRFSGRRTALGTDAIGDHVAAAAAGEAAAYRVLATRSGTQDALRLYVDAGSTASGLSLGLYADAGGTPGALLGAGSAATAPGGAFAEVALAPQPAVTAGRTYWIGVLNAGAGVLRWRDGAGAPSPAQTGVAGLPATWPGARSTAAGPLSAYGVGPAPAAPELGVDVEPARLVFSAAAGGEPPPAQTIAVQANSGGCGPCGWQASGDAAWLSVSPAGGDWPSEVAVSVDPAGLAAGIYRASVSVGRGGAGATTVPVALHVVAPALDLVGAWSLDEASGPTASDSSGHGNDGTIDGPQRTTAGAYGGGLAFEGDGDVLSVAGGASLDVGEGVTVEGWVRPNVLGGIARALAVREGSWALYAAGASGLPGASVVTDAERTAHSAAKLPLAPAWTHLATTYDGNLIRLYVNGRLVATAPQHGAVARPAGPLRVGAAGDEGFDGVIDELRVYNRALSAGEIQADLATPLTPG